LQTRKAMSIRNFEHLFRPRSVAVIGASNRPHSVGATVMHNLTHGGFAGPIIPVNPKYSTVAGLPAFHNLSGLSAAPELAVVCTPPRTVPGLIRQLGEIGTRAAVVLTAGISSEPQEAGTSLRQAMLDAARPYLLRILGPNCIGLAAPGIGLNASFVSAAILPGKVAFVSQSGALTTAILDWATSKDIGFSKFISVGDSADIDFGDMLDHLGSDPDTRGILLYIESVKSASARKFMSAARAAARNKPVIVVKAGRSADGKRAAASHTGAMAGSDSVFDAAIRRAGMLRVDTTQDLFSAVETLARAKPARGDGLLILTNGGGPAVMAADALSLGGGQLTTLADETRGQLDAVLPATWSGANPVDIIGDAPVERYVKALEIMLADAQSGSVLFIHAPTAIVESQKIALACAPLITQSSRNVFGCWLGGGGVEKARQVFNRAGIPTYDTPEEAVQAFLHLQAYRRNQELLLQAPPSESADFLADVEKARQIVQAALREGRCNLDESEVKEIFKAYGIPVVETHIAQTGDDAARIAQQIGFPVALKIFSPDISHKSDAGGIALGLNSAQAVVDAARDMIATVSRLRPDARLDGFMVQAMIIRPAAHELILGSATDATFGPVILFGRGGTATELVNDRAISFPPLNRVLAQDLVSRTRVAKLLQGYRDRPKADLDTLYQILLKLSQLVIDIPELAELDANPMLLDEFGALVLDARIRVEPVAADGPHRLAIRPYPKALEELWQVGELKILLRPVLPSDSAAYQEFLRLLCPQDGQNRFFYAVHQLPASELARVNQIDYDRQMMIVAVRQRDQGTEIIGEMRLDMDPDNQQAELGLAVRTDVQNLGLGSKLLDKGINYCREHGTAEMVGAVLAGNTRMLGLVRKFGFGVSSPCEGIVTIRLDLNSDAKGAA
jgi:acetyltransferase